jgi:ATP-binding cassette subfamily B protein
VTGFAGLDWPIARLEVALDDAIRRRGWPATPRQADARGVAVTATAFERAARALGAGPVELDTDVEVGSRTPVAPGVEIWLDDARAPSRFLVVLDEGSSSPRVLSSDGVVRRIRRDRLEAWWVTSTGPSDEAAASGPGEVLGLAPAEERVVLRRLREAGASRFERPADRMVLRPGPGARVLDLARAIGAGRRLVLFLLLQLVTVASFAAAWYVLGSGRLDGRFSPSGVELAWLLLLASLALTGALAARQQGRLALDAARVLRGRLFRGALRIDPDRLRPLGFGGVLARVLEAERVEDLAFAGGLATLVGALELSVAFFVLALVPESGVARVLLAAGALAVVAAGVAAHRCRRRWTLARNGVVEATVEKLLGHRTRLAQERESDRQPAEDVACAAAHRAAEELDRRDVGAGLVAPTWRLPALLTLVPLVGSAEELTARVAVAIGAVLLGARALDVLATGVFAISGAAVAWDRVAELAAEAAGVREPSSAEVGHSDGSAGGAVELRSVSYSHPGTSRRLLRDLDLKIERGERILLSGASGVGKSTLLGLLAGRHRASSGLVLCDGRDRESLGEREWTRRIVLVPQFHENHVFAGTLAFNVLLGRGWPPSAEDLAEAEAVLRELGLGALIESMPLGLLQPVGDGAWELSHGERGRMFAARALLQSPDVILIDESFGGLDAHSSAVALACAQRRARALLVVTHG